jgi:hypothetical protein
MFNNTERRAVNCMIQSWSLPFLFLTLYGCTVVQTAGSFYRMKTTIFTRFLPYVNTAEASLNNIGIFVRIKVTNWSIDISH